MSLAQASFEAQSASSPWRGFAPGIWQSFVNVREFIQRNYTPYEGDGTFLQGSTERTQSLWQKLLPLLAQEREKGVLDVSQVPAGILAHGPGYIDKDREIIVGLQTDAPPAPQGTDNRYGSARRLVAIGGQSGDSAAQNSRRH